jgi:hypothetical protein
MGEKRAESRQEAGRKQAGSRQEAGRVGDRIGKIITWQQVLWLGSSLPWF